VLNLPMLFGAFQPPGPPFFFTGAKNQELASILQDLPLIIKCVLRQIQLSGFGGRKAPSSMGELSTAEVLRLRATSAVSGDHL
jgi:hypothetical protein